MSTESDWEQARSRFRSDTDHPSGDPLAEQFVSLAGTLFAAPEGEGVADLVGRVAEAAARIVPGADVVSVLLSCDDEYATVARTHELADRVDQVQYDRGEGPSIEAHQTPGVALALSDDLDGETRWPEFVAQASSEGLRSVLATGMFPAAGAVRFGAFTFYSRAPKGFDDADRDRALILAAHAATVIAGARARTASELLTAQLRTALDSRDVIGQAKGILMERRGLDADGAFDVLRRTSQDLNVKLRDLAETLVQRRTEL